MQVVQERILLQRGPEMLQRGPEEHRLSQLARQLSARPSAAARAPPPRAAAAASGRVAGGTVAMNKGKSGNGLKVYISVDIEGVTGSAHWDEAAKLHSDYPQFAERMTQEAVAACEGAIAAGATEIWMKDAHGSGRNIKQEALPDCVTLIRGWSALHCPFKTRRLASSA